MIRLAIIIALLCLLAVVLAKPSPGGQFEDTGRSLDVILEDIWKRLDALESAPPTDPGTDPDPEDPPTPPPTPEPVVSVEPGQDPVSQNRIPGRIQAEDYDLGGEGIAYHDSTPENVGEQYRPDGVDIKTTGDVDGLFQVGWTWAGTNKPNEWIEFTVGGKAGIYDAHFRVACGASSCGRIKVTLDGQVRGTLQVEPTGSWDDDYTTIVLEGIEVRQRNQILRLEFSGGWLDLNWIEFRPQDTAGVNDPPWDIIFLCADGTPSDEGDGCSVPENSPAGTLVGTVKAVPAQDL